MEPTLYSGERLMNGALWIILTVAILSFIIVYWNGRELLSAIGATLGFGFIATIIVFLMVVVASENPKSVEETVWYTKNIHTLRDVNNGLEGSFFLGTGSIGSTWYYQAYVNTDDGFHKEKFEQKITYIKEVDHIKPKVEKYIEVNHNNWFETWLTGVAISNGCCYTKIILYVPRGTIIKEFRLE